MTHYDYYEAVKNDVKQYIEDNGLDFVLGGAFETDEDKTEYLENLLWNEDSVTGNGSGSYTFSTWQAEENLAHNWDLVKEMSNEFGVDLNDDKVTAEYLDVSLRCYVLASAINTALFELGYIH